MSFRERVRRRLRRLFPQEDHTTVQHGLTSNAPSASTGLPERLWDRAYDKLKISDAALIEAYEKILSRKLGGQGFDTQVTASEQNIIAQNDTHARRSQMRQLIQDGLDKTAGEARIKQAMGAAFALSAKDMISAAIQAVPQAALAWTGVCVALEMLQNPIAATEANRSGIEYVIKRMDWYWNLSSAVLKDNANESGFSGVRQEMETRVVDLYAMLLSYEIKSVCSYYRNRGLALLRDIVSLDDWNGDMTALQKAERAFYDDADVYANLRMVSNLDQLVSHAETQSSVQLAKEDQQCIKDLRFTDPSDDKKRIETTKGGLLQESYRWILNRPEYQQWRDSGENRLLWIKGDPGKGKTMLLCGIIDELNRQPSGLGLVSYFLCQATDQELNNATAALRGLIFMLVRQQPSLISHVRKRYDQAGEKLFEGANTWFALSDIFTKILEDPALKGAYLVVDALDECVSEQQKLLDLIVRVSGTKARVKWIVSSRNLSHIEERLQLAKKKVKLSLELNEESIANAVKIYIGEKVLELSNRKGYDEITRKGVRDYLLENANDTFLWVALVCQNLEKYTRWKVLDMLGVFPPGLDSLYERMMGQVLEGDESEGNLCKQILIVMMSVYRPITLRELGSLIEIGQEFSDNVDYLRHIVSLCGSFLTIREDTIYFVHQSAKDYLSKNEDAIFASAVKDVHRTMVSLSLQAMTKILRKNIYALPHVGPLSDDRINMPETDPLSAIKYSCVHWVDHLCKGSAIEAYLEEKGAVCSFLHEHLLHWLEAAIEIAPLQVYSSALVCSPTQSLVRKAFHREIPSWIQHRPVVEDNWSPCLQTLEGHASFVWSIDYSADLMQIVSGSYDKTIKTWDITTGACLQTFEGHTKSVETVAFTADSRRIVSGSDDQSIKIWDLTTGACHRTLRGHTGWVMDIALLENDQIASASRDRNIKIWDMKTGACLQTLRGHTGSVESVAPLTSGLVVSGGTDETIKIWDLATGLCSQTLEGHTGAVYSLTPLANGQLLSGSNDDTVKLWDVASRAFLTDGRVVSGSDDRTVKFWDVDTGVCVRTFEGHDGAVFSVAPSTDGQRIASGSVDRIVKIWDTTTGECVRTFDGHRDWVWAVAISMDGQWVASVSADGCIMIYNEASHSYRTLANHAARIRSVAVSPDGLYVVSLAVGGMIKVWHMATGKCVQICNVHAGWETQLSFDPTMKYRIQGNSGCFDLDSQLLEATLAMLLERQRHRERPPTPTLSPVTIRGYGSTVAVCVAQTRVAIFKFSEAGPDS
ncbi:YVTN repeat-like/Quino protein amine dehydrogenase [Trichoderma citrinoviride]|uniref:Mitochondrial division protein 1 n=1 Tax=Trichoderma citrinoviride TaxID=58853 RepID=A0A2T4B3K3_9HYPO|nr:YVTN repeat-like/Quino protein amine dehydrogenase [Trichoderma citrinoviride]PTB63912.1 YVTN repeat-like/Quino protein amine dehydrogenase [Trichoderma citrinoviride]